MELLSQLPLVDGHCHLLLAGDVEDRELERCITEADAVAEGTTAWDSPAGLAIRRWCAPALDLLALADPSDYLERRRALGPSEATRRLLRAAHLSDLLVDTGLAGPDLGDLPELADAAGASTHEVVRLEAVAEEVAASAVSAEEFGAAVGDRLRAKAATAVAAKSIVAYRYGFDLDPARPGPGEVEVAAREWLSQPGGRLDDPVLLRFLLWAGVDLGLPLQLHAGFGDRDLPLGRSDPSLLQPLLEAIEPAGVPVVLLHCYPYHRQAGWLAAVYPHVHVDLGLTVGQVGARAGAVLAECLELAPWAKVLFSTDGYRLPELYLTGAAQFRHSLGRLLDGWVAEGAMSLGDAERLATMVGGENARRVYRL